MESCTGCNCDYLAFSSDQSFNETSTRICHDQFEPSIIHFNGHKLFIKFDSDKSDDGKGFSLMYKAITSDCGGKLIVPNGIISTPNYPTQNYENNKTCEWNIKTDPAHSITFQLLDFDLQSSTNCSKDVFEVYDPIFKEIIWSGCGNQMPNEKIFKSKRNELNIRLKTDGAVTAKGFKGNFTRNCGGRIIVNDSGEFHFQSRENFNKCIWTIVSLDPTKKIVLTFTQVLLLDTIDKLIVYEGESDDESSVKKVLSQKTATTAIISNGNALTIKFKPALFFQITEFHVHYSILDNGEFLNFFANVFGKNIIVGV